MDSDRKTEEAAVSKARIYGMNRPYIPNSRMEQKKRFKRKAKQRNKRSS